MKWYAEYSKAKARGYIVDESGFIVIGPFIASLTKARDICREHNRTIERLNELQVATFARANAEFTKHS